MLSNYEKYIKYKETGNITKFLIVSGASHMTTRWQKQRNWRKKQTCKFKMLLPETLLLKNKEKKYFRETKAGMFCPQQSCSKRNVI